MRITAEDRRAVSAEVTLEMVQAYLARTGWRFVKAASARCDSIERRDGGMVLIPDGLAWHDITRIIEDVALEEKRQPSEVLSDIVGYQVGLDRGRASVLRNSASAHVVDAREALAAADSALRAKPKERSRQAAVEAARARLEKAEAAMAAATRALEAAEAVNP